MEACARSALTSYGALVSLPTHRRLLGGTEGEAPMPFVEVFAPEGAVRADQRGKISERIVAEVMRGEGAPDTEVARAISWLVWHRVEHWSVGGEAVTPDEPPRYMVRRSVPA